MPSSVSIFSNLYNMISDNSDYLSARIEEARVTKNVDILVLGSSHAYRGFDPRIFSEKGLTLFNLGSSSQTPLQTEVLLERYYEIMNPKIVLFEIYPEVFSLDGVESSVGLLTSDIVDEHIVEMVLRIGNIKLFNSLIFSWIRNLINKQPFSEDASDYTLKQEHQRYIPGGFVERDIAFYQEQSLSEINWDIRTEQIKAFERCLKIIRSNNAVILLVYAPITKQLYESYTGNRIFLNKISQSDEIILNFNELMDVDDEEYFYDKDHLNQFGVELFNRKLLEIESSLDMLYPKY